MRNSSLQGLSLALPLTSFGNVLWFLFSVSLASSIIFLNMSVFVSILLNRALRSENRFMYMLSTCFSDICTGVTYYYVGVLDVKDNLDSPTRTYLMSPIFVVMTYTAILAAQADRYHAVASPFQYSRRMTRNRTVVVICAYWLFGFLLVAVNNLVAVDVARQIWGIGLLLSNIFTVIIMIGLNIRLFIIARFQLEKEPPSVERDTKRSSVYLILVVVMFFLATLLPILCYHIVCIFSGSCFHSKNDATDPLRLLPRLNAALTPILYICGCSPLRATLLTKVWRPCCRRRLVSWMTRPH
ncbi:olfactory receptor 5M1-like [Limanda limanda]|uniref:olfactory receptor 5M1-like n=1 Tax=Limanda limanda TaxID=27771 RepID=UPI0029C86EDD|nr:olfactory receptor 5M1-like [Limanda limanda]